MHEDNNPIGVWILYALASFLLWIVLIFLKLLGVVRISWIGVALGLFWLPLVLMCLICGVAALIILIAHIKRKRRRKVADRRIIRQAKAIRAWTPQAAGGRSLELIGEEYGIKREAGETDRQLRERIMQARSQIRAEAENSGRQEDK
jgi:hypothetical protein